MRVILVMGKGGVGKTTLACATALAAAESGRTLLVSTDAAHSLQDVLAVDLGAEPKAIADGVDGLQLDARHELQRSWGALVGYLRRLVGVTTLDGLQADELVVIPGLGELVALARLRDLVANGSWDALVIDCAPSADSLRLLSLPDVLRWYVDRLFVRGRPIGRWTRRRLERTLAVPAPDDDVIGSLSALGDELADLRAVLDRAITTARLVVTPARVVLAETQRLLTYLALYDVNVDAVLVNRVPGVELEVDSLRPWTDAQRAQLAAIEASFPGLPRLTVRRQMHEPVGIPRLAAIGRELYDGRPPLAVLATSPTLEITTAGPESTVRLPLPGVEREQIELERDDDALIVTVGAHRRSVRLPNGLRDRSVLRAGLNGPYLEVVFGERTDI